MKTKVIITIAFSGIIFTSNAWNSSENNVWLKASVKGSLSEELTFKLSEQIRYKEDGFNYYYRHTEALLQWKFAPTWNFYPAFRYVTATKKDVEVSTPVWHLNLAHKTKLFGVNLKSRLRLYHTANDGSEDLTDLRPKFSLIPSQGWTAWKLKPYVEDEVMINLNDGWVYLNRLSTGLKLTPFKKLSLCAFISQDLYEQTEKADWHERYNYGLSAGLNF